MDKSYKSLFIEMCKTAAVLAERVMDYDKQHKDKEGYETAMKMRNDYNRVQELLESDAELTYSDYVKLLATAYIIVNNLQDDITRRQKAINGYKVNVIPKLTRIMNETKDKPEEMKKLVEELFKNPYANI